MCRVPRAHHQARFRGDRALGPNRAALDPAPGALIRDIGTPRRLPPGPSAVGRTPLGERTRSSDRRRVLNRSRTASPSDPAGAGSPRSPRVPARNACSVSVGSGSARRRSVPTLRCAAQRAARATRGAPHAPNGRSDDRIAAQRGRAGAHAGQTCRSGASGCASCAAKRRACTVRAPRGAPLAWASARVSVTPLGSTRDGGRRRRRPVSHRPQSELWAKRGRGLRLR